MKRSVLGLASIGSAWTRGVWELKTKVVVVEILRMMAIAFILAYRRRLQRLFPKQEGILKRSKMVNAVRVDTNAVGWTSTEELVTMSIFTILSATLFPDRETSDYCSFLA